LDTIGFDDNISTAGYLHNAIDESISDYSELSETFGSLITDIVVDNTMNTTIENRVIRCVD
jgi:(p)ppGpp synthase/HD superfamily hydrolase